MTMRVRDVMAHTVVAVTKDSSFAQVVATLERFRVGAVAVIDADRRVLGVVSEDDLLLKETTAVGHGGLLRQRRRRRRREHRKAGGTTAGELMTAPAVTVTPGTPVREAAILMHDRRIKQLPVIDPVHGRVLGMLRQSDLLKVFERPARELRAEIRRAIADRTALDPGALSIGIEDGMVTIGGAAVPRSQAAELAEAVCSVDGVIAVDVEAAVVADEAR